VEIYAACRKWVSMREGVCDVYNHDFADDERIFLTEYRDSVREHNTGNTMRECEIERARAEAKSITCRRRKQITADINGIQSGADVWDDMTLWSCKLEMDQRLFPCHAQCNILSTMRRRVSTRTFEPLWQYLIFRFSLKKTLMWRKSAKRGSS